MARGHKKVEEAGFHSFNVIAATFHEHYDGILNFYDSRSSNALAEAFNAKVKLFSRPLKYLLLFNNQYINTPFALKCLQVFVSLWLKTCRLYDKQDLSPALPVQFVGRPSDPGHPLYLLADKID